jgi:hypothetical protein
VAVAAPAGPAPAIRTSGERIIVPKNSRDGYIAAP